MSDTTCLLNIHVVAIYMFCIYRVVCQDILNKLVYIDFFMTYCTINFHCTLLCSLYSHQQCVYLHSVLIASADTADLYSNDCMYFNCKGVGGGQRQCLAENFNTQYQAFLFSSAMHALCHKMSYFVPLNFLYFWAQKFWSVTRDG